MTKPMTTITICLLLTCGALPLPVKSAEHPKSGGLSMKQQHETMEVLDRKWDEVKNATKKGDFKAASQSITFIQRRLIPNIAKLQPHGHTGEHNQYIRYHEEFVQSLERLQTTVASNEASHASPELVKSVDRSCKQCHDLFAGGHH
jgi:hypothetical protein